MNKFITFFTVANLKALILSLLLIIGITAALHVNHSNKQIKRLETLETQALQGNIAAKKALKDEFNVDYTSYSSK